MFGVGPTVWCDDDDVDDDMISYHIVNSVAAVLYLQSELHVMLFRPCNTFCTFTLALSTVCVQCPIRLFVVPY
jgi:hypothetical protein